MSSQGFFLTIEGIEGVGKTTALQYIKAFLENKSQPVIFTREPGGTPLAENIRNLLLSANEKEKITLESELLLMFAARSQHVANVIEPALKAGKWVISDRFVDASYAYQGGGRRIDPQWISLLEKWVVKNVQPNATILLDAPPEIGLERAKNKGAYDRIEQEKIEFFERVRAAYLDRARQYPERFYVINATAPIDSIQQQLIQLVEQWIGTLEIKST